MPTRYLDMVVNHFMPAVLRVDLAIFDIHASRILLRKYLKDIC